MMLETNMLKMMVLALFIGACGQSEGTRCNPLQFSENGVQGDCDDGYACVYPTAPACGVAYCCAVDGTGAVVDTSPRCQPDPQLQSVCMLDLASPTVDAAQAEGD